MINRDPSPFSAPGDPGCRHRSHYECVACRKIVCARCGAVMAETSDKWLTHGFWCEDCLREDDEDEVS